MARFRNDSLAKLSLLSFLLNSDPPPDLGVRFGDRAPDLMISRSNIDENKTSELMIECE